MATFSNSQYLPKIFQLKVFEIKKKIEKIVSDRK